jgi:pimeloyl-ACP methyl ester carboxylesterase
VDGTAFDCGESLGDLRVIDSDPAAASRFAGRCNDVSSALVGNVGTRQSVEDLEEFRASLGFEKVRFLGWSYGATLGAAWAMTYPRSIRSMVLDAPSDPRRPWAESLRERYAAMADAFEQSLISTWADSAGNPREQGLAREYILYEPSTAASGDEILALRLGETSNGANDGGIETQIGVHCSDVTHAEARDAINVVEPSPKIGFGASFDRVCLELAESRSPLSVLAVDHAATRIDAMVVSSTGDHVIPAAVSRALARDMSWRNVTVDASRHLGVGFDTVATKTAISFLATGN